MNLWGFQKVVNGPDRGGYYHELFLRGRPDLAPIMLRVKGCSAMEGRKAETTSAVVMEDPDFYVYPYCEENTNRSIVMTVTTTASSAAAQRDDHVASQRPKAAAAILIEPSSPPDSPRSAQSSPPRRRKKNAASSSSLMVVTPPYESKTVDLDESRWVNERRKLPFQHDIRELHRSLAHEEEEEDTSESSSTSTELLLDLEDDDDDALLLHFEGRSFQTVEECNTQALDSILRLEEEALYAKSVLSEVKRMNWCLGHYNSMGVLPSSPI